MRREDDGLAFLLQYENVAWYEHGTVRILDRRIYPTKIVYVTCNNYKEVAQAVHDMVTQSAGPYTAMGFGMALAAYEARLMSEDKAIVFLQNAAYELSQARPTTSNRYYKITLQCLNVALEAITKGMDMADAIVYHTIESLNRRYATMEKIANYLIDKIPNDGTVLTQCFGETIIAMLCRVAKEQQKIIHFYHAETRPYLQGARLTASVCHEMGFDSTVITDNMVAYVMENKKIDIFTSAADSIAMDGYIANKIGTYQIAILAQYFNIPYFVTGIPDVDKKSGKDIVIEERDANQILQIYGVNHVLKGVKGLYPAFDITAPHLIDGIVTEHGIFEINKLNGYLKKERTEFY